MLLVTNYQCFMKTYLCNQQMFDFVPLFTWCWKKLSVYWPAAAKVENMWIPPLAQEIYCLPIKRTTSKTKPLSKLISCHVKQTFHVLVIVLGLKTVNYYIETKHIPIRKTATKIYGEVTHHSHYGVHHCVKCVAVICIFSTSCHNISMLKLKHHIPKKEEGNNRKR